MALYVVGQIVRPKRTFARTDGSLQDWAGKRSAQGRVASVGAVATVSSAVYWNPATSNHDSLTEVAVQTYSVQVWNPDSRAYETAVYPEDQIDVGTNGIATITALFPDPTTLAAITTYVDATGATVQNNPAANVMRTRL